MNRQALELARNVAIALDRLNISEPTEAARRLLSNEQRKHEGCTIFSVIHSEHSITLRIGSSGYKFEPTTQFDRPQMIFCLGGHLELLEGDKKKEISRGAFIIVPEGVQLSGSAWSNFMVLEVNRGQSFQDDPFIQLQN